MVDTREYRCGNGQEVDTGPWTITPQRDGRLHIACDSRKGVRPVMELLLDPNAFSGEPQSVERGVTEQQPPRLSPGSTQQPELRASSPEKPRDWFRIIYPIPFMLALLAAVVVAWLIALNKVGSG